MRWSGKEGNGSPVPLALATLRRAAEDLDSVQSVQRVHKDIEVTE